MIRDGRPKECSIKAIIPRIVSSTTAGAHD